MTDDSTTGTATLMDDAADLPTVLEIPTAMPPRMPLKPSQCPPPSQPIHIPDDCFNFSRRGTVRNKQAEISHRSHMKKKLKNAILNTCPTTPQQAWTLRAAVTDKDVRLLSASAGTLPSPTSEHIVANIKETTNLATKTKHANGRPTNDKRSLVQSMVLASPPSPSCNGFKPTRCQISTSLGMNLWSHDEIVKAASPKRAALEAPDDKETIHSQVKKSKGWRWVTQDRKDKTCSFIWHHPHVVVSPNKNDTLLVPDDNNPSKKVRKTKLLLQGSVRELHNDIVRQLEDCTKGNKMILSDSTLRSILPPEVCPMTDNCKQTCCCINCVQMKLHQTTCNHYKRFLLKKLKSNLDATRLGARSRKPLLKKCQSCQNCCHTDESVGKAIQNIICKPCHDTASNDRLKDLCDIKCALGKCDNCPKFKQHSIEANCDEMISFQSCQCVHRCSEHGALPSGESVCRCCEINKDTPGLKTGRIEKKRQ